MTSRASAVALAIAGALFGISVAAAQTTPPPSSAPPGFKNLKVLPQDISRQKLLSNMRFFSQSLGVRCTFCHVGVERQAPSTFDFASDGKKEKLIARKMLLMVQRINTQDFGQQPAMANMKVTCFTCHRGSTKPLTEAPPSTTAPPSAPAPAAKTLERGAS